MKHPISIEAKVLENDQVEFVIADETTEPTLYHAGRIEMWELQTAEPLPAQRGAVVMARRIHSALTSLADRRAGIPHVRDRVLFNGNTRTVTSVRRDDRTVCLDELNWVPWSQLEWV